VVAVAWIAAVGSPGAQARPDLETAWAAFWAAEDPAAAARTIPAFVDAGVTHDDALVRLGAGRRYAGDVETGDHTRRRRGDYGVAYRYVGVDRCMSLSNLVTKPVYMVNGGRVTTNGAVSFEGAVEPDVSTLLRWAARDNDRTMLFADERPIGVRHQETAATH
jgi:hypothetical protein